MKPIYEYILANLGALTLLLLVAAWIIKTYVKPSIEAKINHIFDLAIENERANMSLANKRIDIASQLLDEVSELCDAVQCEIEIAVSEIMKTDEYKRQANQDDRVIFIINKIMQTPKYHPDWRRKFVKLSHKFEKTNELFSHYTIQLENLLHQDSLKNIFSREFIKGNYESKKFKSDFIYSYKNIWKNINASLNSLFRINTTDIAFWSYSGESSYGEISKKYSKIDLEHIKNQCCLISSGKGFCEAPDATGIYVDGVFSISLENREKLAQFWIEIKE